MRKFFVILFYIGFIGITLSSEALDINALKKEQHWFDEQIAFGPLPIESAKKAIINWAGRQNLSINLLPYDDPEWTIFPESTTSAPLGIEGITVPYGRFPSFPNHYFLTNYAFWIKDPNPDKKYSGYVFVDSWSGRIVAIKKFIRRSSILALLENRTSISDMISPQRAKALAYQYLSDYFPQIAQIAFNKPPQSSPPTTSDESSWEWFEYKIGFISTQVAQNVSDYFVSIYVNLDCYTGELIGIYCRYYDVMEVSPHPYISEETALETALSFLYGLGAEHIELERVDKSFPLRESPNGRQRVAYDILLKNTSAREDAPLEIKRLLGDINFPHKLLVRMDIHTGEILAGLDTKVLAMRTEFFESPHLYFNARERKAEILTIGKDAFILANDIKELGFSLQKSRGRYVLNWGQENVMLEEKKIKSEGRKMYISISALNKLKRVKAIYSNKLKTIDMWTINEKAQKDSKKLLMNKKLGMLNLVTSCGLALASLGYLGVKLLKFLF